MERPNKNDYRPFDLTGDAAIAKWMIDYSEALEKYIESLKKVNGVEKSASNCKNVTVHFDIDKLKIINEKLNDTCDERAGHDSWKSDEFEEFCDMINTAIENYVK